MKSPWKKNAIYPIATSANVSSRIPARGELKNPIRIRVRNELWCGRPELYEDARRARRGAASEGNAPAIFSQLDPNTRTTPGRAYFSFCLFSWPSSFRSTAAARYHVSVRALRRSLFPLFLSFPFPPTQRRVENFSPTLLAAHLSLACVKISHTPGPVIIARGVNYARAIRKRAAQRL